MDRNTITNYVNTFRNTFGTSLIPGVGVDIKISELPTRTCICFSFAVDKLNSTKFIMKFNNVQAVLKHLGFTDDNRDEGRSVGTTVIMQGMKFAVIKDDDPIFWTDERANGDALSILNHIRETKK